MTTQDARTGAALHVRDLEVELAGKHVLRGLDLTVDAGGVACVLGHNGAGKSTLMRALAGLIPISGGTVTVGSTAVGGDPAWMRSRNGIRLVPQGTGFFKDLSVTEHLQIASSQSRDFDRALAFDLFPRLAERRDQPVGTMSGGERQMVALSLALSGNPRLLLLDELSTGLQPSLVHEVLESVRAFGAERGTTLVLVEQSIAAALDFSDTVNVMSQGRFVLQSDVAQADRDKILDLI